MSTRRENAALVERLSALIDDVVRDLRRAEGNAPSTEDRP